MSNPTPTAATVDLTPLTTEGEESARSYVREIQAKASAAKRELTRALRHHSRHAARSYSSNQYPTSRRMVSARMAASQGCSCDYDGKCRVCREYSWVAEARMRYYSAMRTLRTVARAFRSCGYAYLLT